MTPEGKVKAKIRKILKRFGCWHYWPVPSGFGRRTVDVLGLYKGHAFAIEAKAPGKEPTDLQYKELREITNQGGEPFIISDDEGLKDLEIWLESIDDGDPRQR